MLKNMTKTQKIMAIVLVAVIVGTIIFVFYKRSQKSKIEEATELNKEDKEKDAKHLNNGEMDNDEAGEIKYKVIKKEMKQTPREEKVTTAPEPISELAPEPEAPDTKKGSKKVKGDDK